MTGRTSATPASHIPAFLREERGRRALALVLLVLATLPMLTKIFTSDYGTHLALGRRIVQEREIASHEVWNHPSLGMAHRSEGEWGFQAILWSVYAAGGHYGVSAMIGMVVLGIFLLLHRAMVLRGADPLVAVAAIVAFSGFLRIRIQPRPEIFTYLFIALTIYMLSEYYYGTRKRLLYLFPALILVWANMHPTYLIAFILSGAFFLDALVRAALRKELRWADLKGWVAVPVAAGAVGLAVVGLNPHGYSWLLAPLHIMDRTGGGGGEGILTSISELTPVKGTGMYVYFKAAAVLAAASAVLGAFGRRVTLLDLFLAAIAFKGAWGSSRAVSMMGLFLSPGVSLQLTGFFQRLLAAPAPAAGKRGGEGAEGEGRRRPGKGRPAPAPTPAPRRAGPAAARAAVVGVAVAALVVFGAVTLAFSFSNLEFGVGVTEHKFSFKAADFLRADPVPGKMFNFFDIGGFLDWQLHPQALTFIDGRAFNRQVFMEHQVVTGAMAGWQRVIDKYGITYAVLKTIDSSGMVLPIVWALTNDPGWALVFSDGLFVVFVRRTPETEGYIRRHEIDKRVIPQHIAWEAYHYMYLGVSPVIAYNTISTMYEYMGNRAAAIEALRKVVAMHDDPFFQARLRRLEQGLPSR